MRHYDNENAPDYSQTVTHDNENAPDYCQTVTHDYENDPDYSETVTHDNENTPDYCQTVTHDNGTARIGHIFTAIIIILQCLIFIFNSSIYNE